MVTRQLEPIARHTASVIDFSMNNLRLVILVSFTVPTVWPLPQAPDHDASGHFAAWAHAGLPIGTPGGED